MSGHEQVNIDSDDEYNDPRYKQKSRSPLCSYLSFCFLQMVLLIAVFTIMASTYGIDIIIATSIFTSIIIFILIAFILVSILYAIHKFCCNRSGRLFISYPTYICHTICIWYCCQFIILLLLCTILIVTNHPYWKGPFEEIFLDSNKNDITVRPYFQTTQYSAEILRPHNISEIQHIIIKYGLNEGYKIRAIGSAHSSSPLFTNDILISMDNFNNITINKQQQTVIVGSGAVLQDVENYLYKYGYVLTGFGSVQEQRMGGMLGTSVYGIYGSINKHVINIWFVDGNGNDLLVTKAANTTWIDALKVNIGLLGIIYQIEFAIQPTFNVQKSSTSVSVDHFEKLSVLQFSSFFFPDDIETLGTRLRMSGVGFQMELFKNTTKDANIINYERNKELRSLINNVLLPLSCLIPETDLLCDQMEWNAETNNIDKNIYSAKSSLMSDAIFHGGFIYAIPFENCHNALMDLKDMLIKYFPSHVNVIPLKQDDEYGLLSYGIDSDVCMIEIYPKLCGEDRLKLGQEFETNILLKYNGTSHWGKQLITMNDINDLSETSIIKFWNGFDLFNDIREISDPNDIFLNDYLKRFFDSMNETNSDEINVEYPLIDEYRQNGSGWEATGWFSIIICFVVTFIIAVLSLNDKFNEYLLLYNNDNERKFIMSLSICVIIEVIIAVVLFFVVGMTVEIEFEMST